MLLNFFILKTPSV